MAAPGSFTVTQYLAKWRASASEWWGRENSDVGLAPVLAPDSSKMLPRAPSVASPVIQFRESVVPMEIGRAHV